MTLYQHIAEQTGQLIASGVLRAGDRLPSVRHVCRSQGVSAVTVMQAYYLLESRGLIEARPRSGYFVRARIGRGLAEPRMPSPAGESAPLQVSDFIFQILESVKDRSVVPLGSSFPAPQLFPFTRLGRSLAGAARRLDPLATITDLPPGNAALRRHIARRYHARGALVPPEEIVITSGAMEGLNLCLQAVTRPGDVVAVESPTFYAGLQASERLGLQVIEIPSHPREGVSVEALERALERHPVKACLFMLNFANPTGALVPMARREALVALLRRHQVPLIEDDVYAELYFGAEPPPCTRALEADGLVMHVSSFSKCLAPGFRVGWVAGGRFARRIVRQKLTTSLATMVAAQDALADYLGHGGYDHHLRRLRQALARGEAELVQAVERHFPPGTRLARPAGGYFLWLELPPGVDALALHQDALAHGISLAPGPIFSAQREFGHCIRLNFGHPLAQGPDEAVAALAELVARQSGRR
ncbi:PLP-dependent aminotransferase family protein [Pseudothauera nasutitermitis]|uniref:PLP-dependent aminotransferase family protein n=1 Tax=Pseudothauera nasutitermitis TaxID=2565930 RepID=A0A4S4ASI7_9RHOO|nr:PLP-dependent aminotransferase family protein [Pseudothauera nasutitermitis]THF61474.1 PLP-dependent aminotransferase family protein [Pseudothauera nasutitermitis]